MFGRDYIAAPGQIGRLLILAVAGPLLAGMTLARVRPATARQLEQPLLRVRRWLLPTAMVILLASAAPVLALATSCRHPATALALASANFPDADEHAAIAGRWVVYRRSGLCLDAGVHPATDDGALILDYVRTPRAKASAKGSLHDRTATDLLVLLENALVERSCLDPSRVDDVIVGCASQVDEQGANIARTSAVLAGWGDGVPGVTLNRFCASGIDAVGQAAARLRAGDLNLAVAGGVESVSRVPMFADRGPLWSDPATVRAVGSVHMGVAADLNATIEGFRRPELDQYGVETQQKAAAAWTAGVFGRSVVAVPADDRGRGLDRDELVRAETTFEALTALPPAFAELGAGGQDDIALGAYPGVSRIEHLHTVGTSPQMADGAALLLIGTPESARAADIAPRGRILATATTAVNPVVMLTAGQSAVQRVIARAGLTPGDIDVFEFAEAFSALCLRFRRDLDAGPERMNPNGGTMAMGHAFGATGAILVGSCLEELERRDGRYGVAAVSGAAGLGVAVLVERLTAA